MRDKDIDAILARLAPLVDAWHFTDLPSPRAATAAELAERWRALAGEAARRRSRRTRTRHRRSPRRSPAQTPLIEFVVFGSFYTVGGVLAHGLPQRAGRHVV